MTSPRRAVTSRGHLSDNAIARCQATATSRCEMAPPTAQALRAHSQRHGETPPLRKIATAIGRPLSQSASQARSRCRARLLSNTQRRRVCSAAERDWGRASASRPPAFLPALRGDAAAAGWRPRLPVRAAGAGSVVMRKSGGRASVVPEGGGRPRRPAAQVSLGARDRALPPPFPPAPQRLGRSRPRSSRREVLSPAAL